MKHIKTDGFALVTVLLVVLMVTVGGAGYYVYNRQNNSNDSLTNLSADEANSIAEALPDDISGVVEFSTIQSKITDKTIAQIELQTEDGSLVFKVTFTDGTATYFDALTGLAADKDVDTSEAEDTEALPASFVPGVTFAQARATAMTEMPGKSIIKIELELEEGSVVYSVRFSDNSRVDVNAVTGAVVSSKDHLEENEVGDVDDEADDEDEDDDDEEDEDDDGDEEDDDEDEDEDS